MKEEAREEKFADYTEDLNIFTKVKENFATICSDVTARIIKKIRINVSAGTVAEIIGDGYEGYLDLNHRYSGFPAVVVLAFKNRGIPKSFSKIESMVAKKTKKTTEEIKEFIDSNDEKIFLSNLMKFADYYKGRYENFVVFEEEDKFGDGYTNLYGLGYDWTMLDIDVGMVGKIVEKCLSDDKYISDLEEHIKDQNVGRAFWSLDPLFLNRKIATAIFSDKIESKIKDFVSVPDVWKKVFKEFKKEISDGLDRLEDEKFWSEEISLMI